MNAWCVLRYAHRKILILSVLCLNGSVADHPSNLSNGSNSGNPNLCLELYKQSKVLAEREDIDKRDVDRATTTR